MRNNDDYNLIFWTTEYTNQLLIWQTNGWKIKSNNGALQREFQELFGRQSTEVAKRLLTNNHFVPKQNYSIFL